MEPAAPADFVRDEFSCKPNFDEAMARIEAWYKGEIIDRAPVRFHGHNAGFDFGEGASRTPEQWKAHWFDFDAVVERTVQEMESVRWPAETFPVFMPNLGPTVYAAFYGCELTFEEITSWAQHFARDRDDLAELRLDRSNECYRGTWSDTPTGHAPGYSATISIMFKRQGKT